MSSSPLCYIELYDTLLYRGAASRRPLRVETMSAGAVQLRGLESPQQLGATAVKKLFTVIFHKY